MLLSSFIVKIQAILSVVGSNIRVQAQETWSTPVDDEYEDSRIIGNPPPLYFGDYEVIVYLPNNSNSEAKLCGFPVYCEHEECLYLRNISNATLSNCEIRGGFAMFCLSIILMSLTMIFMNSAMPVIVLKKREMRTQYNYIKASLAFADMLNGFVILFMALPNMIWMRYKTEREISTYTVDDINSANAIVSGSLVMISMQASLLHLLFLSMERFSAIKWPIWHHLRKTSTVVLTLVIIWILALCFAFIPALFSTWFNYQFQPILLMHIATFKATEGDTVFEQLGAHGIIYILITVILPYILTLIFCIAAGITSYIKLSQREKKFNSRFEDGENKDNKNKKKKISQNPTDKRSIKPEVFILITIIIMIVAFTITLLPFGIVIFLYFGEVLTCSNFALPYALSFYGTLTNSLMNVIIYCVRDKRYRDAIRDLTCHPKLPGKNESQRTHVTSL